MSGISRRALFGISAGAAATAVVPQARAEAKWTEFQFSAEHRQRTAEIMKQQFPQEWMIAFREDA